MSKGIIYLMSTVVSGLIKIGQTRSDQFEIRMKNLENNGYANVTGLKREFAIEVDEYENKEKLIHEIFSKSRIASTELFALDIEMAKSLLSSLEGKQIFPKDKSKEEVFKEATEELEIQHEKSSMLGIPDGEYILSRRVKTFGQVHGKAIVKDGVFTVLKGSRCATITGEKLHSIREKAKIKDSILQEDIICPSPSAAGWVIIGKSNDGWIEWKDLRGNPIKIYKSKRS